MRLDDDRKPPLSTERSDLYWGTHDTYTDRFLEESDEPPSRSLLRATAHRVPGHGTPGADRPVTPLSPARGELPDGSPRPTPEEN